MMCKYCHLYRIDSDFRVIEVFNLFLLNAFPFGLFISRTSINKK